MEVKFRVNYGGGNGAGCFEVKVWADTTKFTDVIVTGLVGMIYCTSPDSCF